MSFWKVLGGGIFNGVVAGVGNVLSTEVTNSILHKHGSKSVSRTKTEHSAIGHKDPKGTESLVEIANLTSLATENYSVASNHSLVPASNLVAPTKLTAMNGSAIARPALRPRSSGFMMELGEDVDGALTAGEQNPAACLLCCALLFVAILALAAVRFKRRKRGDVVHKVADAVEMV